MPAVLTPTAQRLLDMLPPFERNSYDMQAVQAAYGDELDRLEAAMLDVAASPFATRVTADKMSLLEAMLGIPTNLSIGEADRRATILANMRRLVNGGAGTDWVATMTELIGSAWSYHEHDFANPSAVPLNTIRILLPFAGALPSPLNLAGTSLAGGSFTAGTYYWGVTAVNSWGETVSSVELSKTLTAGREVSLTWDAVAGATGYRIYRGTSAGSLFLVDSASTNAYTDVGAATQPTAPPVINTTRPPQAAQAEHLAREITPAHIDLVFAHGTAFILNTSLLGSDTL